MIAGIHVKFLDNFIRKLFQIPLILFIPPVVEDSSHHYEEIHKMQSSGEIFWHLQWTGEDLLGLIKEKTKVKQNPPT